MDTQLDPLVDATVKSNVLVADSVPPHQSPFWIGEPGVGKTAIVEACATHR